MHPPTPHTHTHTRLLLQMFSSRELIALCFTGLRLQDWGRSSGSLPQLNHLSLEYQDCHSCSTGPFLETKQGHRRNVCMALSGLSAVHSYHMTGACRTGINAFCISLGCKSGPVPLSSVVTAFGLVCQIILSLLFLKIQCHL